MYLIVGEVNLSLRVRRHNKDGCLRNTYGEFLLIQPVVFSISRKQIVQQIVMSFMILSPKVKLSTIKLKVFTDI